MGIKKIFLLVMMLGLFLFGCSEKVKESDENAEAGIREGEEEKRQEALQEIEFDTSMMNDLMEEYGDVEAIEIEFSTSPEKLTTEEPTVLTAKVSKEDGPVTDAIVFYEISQAGNVANAITVDAKGNGAGTYELAGEFSEHGKYNVIVHVTAAGSHQMLPYQFTIE